MDFLLQNIYSNGDIPEELKKYKNFVDRVKGIDTYHRTLEAKLQRSARILKDNDSVSEADDRIYARALVSVLESDQEFPDKSKVLVLFEGEQLYEEDVPEYAFLDLPGKSVLVFEYTSQGLNFNLNRTMENSKLSRADSSRAERIIINSLASDPKSKKYVDSIYQRIDEQLSK
jgi:hypothetical protein